MLLLLNFLVLFHYINLQTFVRSMKQLNLFKMANQRTEVDIKQQKLTTRVYLTLLIGIEEIHFNCMNMFLFFYL